MKPIIAAPLVAVVLVGAGVGAYYAVAGAGSGEEAPAAQPTSTPTPTQQTAATPTPEPTPAPDPDPTPTPTPAPSTEGGQAPKGCLPTELAYVDPDGRFAFCYPSDMELATIDSQDGIQAANVQQANTEPQQVAVNVAWRPERRSATGELCSASPFIVKNRRIEVLSISGRSIEACMQDHYDPSQPDVLLHTTIEIEVPSTGGGFVRVFAGYTEPDAAVVVRILDSVLIN